MNILPIDSSILLRVYFGQEISIVTKADDLNIHTDHLMTNKKHGHDHEILQRNMRMTKYFKPLRYQDDK